MASVAYERAGHSLKLIQWNLNGCSKRTETALRAVISGMIPDVVLLQELKVRYHERDRTYVPYLKNFSIYYASAEFSKVAIGVRAGTSHVEIDSVIDHNDRVLRGIENSDPRADYTANSGKTISHSQWTRAMRQTMLYVVCVEIGDPYAPESSRFLIVNHYRPQQGFLGGCEPVHLQRYVAQLRQRYPNHMLLVGADINAHHIAWMSNAGEGDPSANVLKMGHMVNDWRLKSNLLVLTNGQPTRRGSKMPNSDQRRRGTSPDIIFGSSNIDPDAVEYWVQDLGEDTGSDHFTLMLEIDLDSSVREKVKERWVIRSGDGLDWDTWKLRMKDQCKWWFQNGGQLIRDALDGYIDECGHDHSWNEQTLQRWLFRYNLDKGSINVACVCFIKDVVEMSRELFGMRKQRSAQDELPWFTQALRESYVEFTEYQKMYRSWSRCRRRMAKATYVEKLRVFSELMESAHKDWVDEKLLRFGAGKCSWKEICAVIKYDSRTNSIIPTWRDAKGVVEAATSREKAEIYLHKVAHRFEDRDWDSDDEKEDDPELIKRFNEFKAERKTRVTAEQHKRALNELNSPISLHEIRRAIMAMSKDSAPFEDEFAVQYLQRAVDMILPVMDTCYNGMILFQCRDEHLNMRNVKLVPKSGKPKDRKENYRPVSLMAVFSKPLDSIMGQRYVSFGAKTKVLPPCHYGFMPGTGAPDCLVYVVDRIQTQINDGKSVHCLLLDFMSAFDLVETERCLTTFERDFGVVGNALEYLRCCFHKRMGNVIVNNYASEWREEKMGLLQGWPPAAVCFLFYVVDFDFVNTLKLGVELTCFADDTTMLSDGTSEGLALEVGYNEAIEVTTTIARWKHLIFVPPKQKYALFDPRLKTVEQHRSAFLNLMMDGVKVKQVAKPVRILGLLFDRLLTWRPHIDLLVSNAHRAFMAIVNRYRHAHYIEASWVPKILESFVLSKMKYMSAVWTCADQTHLTPVHTLYKDMVRFAQGGRKDAELDFQRILLGWPSFEQWILAQQASLFSSVIRVPVSVGLSDIVSQRWTRWQRRRDENDERWPRGDLPVEEFLRNEDYPGEISCIRSGLVEDAFSIEPDENDEFEVRDKPLAARKRKKSKRKRAKKKGRRIEEASDEDGDHIEGTQKEKRAMARAERDAQSRVLDRAFTAAAVLKTTDYIFMLGVPYRLIPKRVTYHIRAQALPDNVTFYAPVKDEKGVLIGFTPEWFHDLKEIQGINPAQILMAMSDGSLSQEKHGGCGFFAVLLSHMGTYVEDDVRAAHFDPESCSVNDVCVNGVSNFLSMSVKVARRTSIEYCELKGVDTMVQRIIEFIDEIADVEQRLNEADSKEEAVESEQEPRTAVDSEQQIRIVSISVDSRSVVEWIGGESTAYGMQVALIIQSIYSGFMQLKERGVQVILSWVRAHNATVENELADDRARLGMMNARFSLKWERWYSTEYGAEDWKYISGKSVRRECAKAARKATVEKWKLDRDQKRVEILKSIQLGKRTWLSYCSRYITKWRIGAHSAYKKEMRAMNRRQWVLLSSMRGGRVALNAEVKYGGGDGTCKQRFCHGQHRETILHYIFRCAQYKERRRRMMITIGQIYRKAEINWDELPDDSMEQRWKMMLFPFQAEMTQSREKDVLERLMALRKEVLFALLSYVVDTERLDERVVGASAFDM